MINIHSIMNGLQQCNNNNLISSSVATHYINYYLTINFSFVTADAMKYLQIATISIL